nr:FixG Ig-like domain-containing protein [Gammaproteobacteria bacterium]
GKRKRTADRQGLGLGDCIDCTLCVQVCPTGIDIRKGLQYQCIGCAACVDVCDDVMDKMGYDRGLVRYTTESGLKGRPAHPLRPRILVYATLLLAMTAGLIYAISQRIPLELDVIRDRTGLYRETSEGLVENVYNLKVINMDEREHVYRLSASGLPEMEFINRKGELTVAAGEVYNLPVRIRIDPIHLTRSTNEITFHIEATDAPELAREATSRFIGPVD